MVPRIAISILLLISTATVSLATQIECDAVTTDLRNSSTTDDLCVIVIPRQKWNISSVDLSTVSLPRFDKFSLIGVNGSFSVVDFFSSKTHLGKLLIYDSVMPVVEVPFSVESLLLTESHTRQIVINSSDDHQYAMHTLIVVDNEISDLPRNIHQLVRLKSLTVAKNLLEEIDLTELSGLKELETVDLSENHIREFFIGEIDLPSLFKLDLSHNKLKSIPTKLRQLPSLEELRMSHNKLEYVEMSHFNGLTKLNVLDLRFNNLLIGSLSPVLLPALEVLRLESCQLQQLDLLGIETPKLRKLHVEDNKLEYVEGFFNDVYQDVGFELYGDRNPWNCNWLQDKHGRVKFVVQQDRQTCRRFVKNVCCVGSDYATERKADRRLQVVKEQSRLMYKVLEEQQEQLRTVDKNCGGMGDRLAKIERTLEEMMGMVKMITAKVN